jgi:asparagine synthase (glutamine-hydrolysing)
MCGIAGILDFSHSANIRTAIQHMTECIAHRGPDAQGNHIDEDLALGHRRLSIIDLSEVANQPITDHTGRYTIIFNGEIYNYQEVRTQIHHYPFRTQSDTEVILAAYELWGPAFLKKLNGMFAFALWDKKEKQLLIARDRLGKKPLYYYQDKNVFAFSSEVRSLLASGFVPRRLNESMIGEFLMYQAPLGPHTLVQGVKQLQAGHYAIIKEKVFTEYPYWQYEDVEKNDDAPEQAKDKIKELFLDSVRLRMIADVPVGAFLSGGIDSSMVVACMAELSTQPVHTFSISFQEKEFDESVFAEIIAKKYHTQHHKLVMKPEEFLDSLEDILSAMDSPSGDGPNTYLVAKKTKQEGMKVALSGLGGDELFAGYEKFLMYDRIMRQKWISSIPLFLRKQISKPFSRSGMPRQIKLAELLLLDKWKLSTVYTGLRRSYSPEEAAEILSVAPHNNYVEQQLDQIDKATCWMGRLSKATLAEMETYTRDVLLRDTDQMAMAHALEVRAPFFDHRLVEYVLSLPDHLKYPHTPKKLLVDALSPRLPDEIVHRRKMGFTFPIKRWLKSELRNTAQEKIDYLAGRKEFNSRAVTDKWDHFLKRDQKILWPRVWQLVVLSDWIQRNKL